MDLVHLCDERERAETATVKVMPMVIWVPETQIVTRHILLGTIG